MLVEAIHNYKKQHHINHLPQLKAALFDMDGVIFDSMPYHASSWVKAFEKVGIAFTEYQVYLNEGRTGASTIQNEFSTQKNRLANNEEIQSIYNLKSMYFEQCGEPIPMKFAKDTLQRSLALNLAIYLVTGSGQKSLLNTLNTFFPEIFSENNMVTAYDVKKGKPDPEPYLMALQKGQLQAHQAFVVENAPLGIQASVAANLFTIGINTGILEDSILYDAGAHLVLDSLESFYHILPSLQENWK